MICLSSGAKVPHIVEESWLFIGSVLSNLQNKEGGDGRGGKGWKVGKEGKPRNPKSKMLGLIESAQAKMRNPIRFAYTILYVKDVARSLAFYEQAFEFKPRFTHEGGDYADLETSTTTLTFAANNLAKLNLPEGFQENDLSNLPVGFEIGLVTHDVAMVFEAAVEAGTTIVAEPKVKPWSQTVAYVRDLDGILVSINSPM